MADEYNLSLSKNQLLIKAQQELSEQLYDLPELTLYLLSGVANIEKKDVLEVFSEIEKRRQHGVDIISAVLVFLTSYLSFHLKENNTSKRKGHPAKFA